MAKKIPIVGVNVTSNISGTVQPLGPVFGNGIVSTNSLKSTVDSDPSIVYATGVDISALISTLNEIISMRGLVFADVYDTSLIREIVALLVSKKFGDRVDSISDLITEIIFNKGLFSSVGQNDVLTRTVDFNRIFSDIEMLLDRQSINFSKLLTDSANPIDITGVGDGIAFDFSKVLTNLVSTSDSLSTVTNFNRKLEDIFTSDDDLSILSNKSLKDTTTSLDDSEIISFTKLLTDSVNPIDITGVGDGIAFDFSKVLVDLANTVDNLSTVTNFNRKLEDEITLINDKTSILSNKGLKDTTSLDDSEIISFIKRPFETINVLEAAAIDSNKVLNNVSVIQDLKLLNIVKPFSDSFTVDDSDTIDFTKGNFETILSSDKKENVVFSKVLSDAPQPLDLLALDVEKILSDAQGMSDLDTIDFTKFNADSVSTESITVLATIKVLYDLQSTEDETTLNFEKNAFDSITTDSNLRFDFIKFLADTAAVEDLTNVFDGSTYAVDKTVTDFVNINENFSRIINFNRAFNDNQLISDLPAIDLSKILSSFSENNDNLKLNIGLNKTDNINIDDNFSKVTQFNRLFIDQQNQIDLSVINLAKALTDIISTNDEDTLSVTKVLSDLSNISEISVIDFNKHIRLERVITLDLFNRTVSFNRSLTEDVLQPDLAALSITKPFSDTMGYSDGPIQFDSNGWAADYVVSGYIFDTRVVFDVIKALADINTTADNDFYSINKPLLEVLIPIDVSAIAFSRTNTDSVLLFDDNPDINMNKALFETQSTADNDVYNLAKVLSELVNPLDNDVINFVKIRADENIVLDDDIIAFNKAAADSIFDLDGPIQFGSDGWAVDYVVSGYIFDTRVIFDIIKPLNEIMSVPDSDFYTLSKPLSEILQEPIDADVWDFNKPVTETLISSDDNDINVNKPLFETNIASDVDSYDLVKSLSELITLLDTDIINFVKIQNDETIILDNNPITFTKPFTEILNNIDGPIQFDSDGWAIGYVVSGYIFDTRPVFGVIKSFADNVLSLDNIDVFDGSTHSLNKVNADNVPIIESNIVQFIKPLSDLQEVNSQTGLNVVKPLTDSFSINDQTTKVTEFNRGFSDSITLIEAGKVSNQNYIADYFAEDYIGEVRLIA